MNILSLISQNLNNFYQIQTNCYSAHLMRTVAYRTKSGVPDLGTEQGPSYILRKLCGISFNEFEIYSFAEKYC
jgi:hypothetical protein